MLRFICIGVLALNSLWAPAALGVEAAAGAAVGGAAVGGAAASGDGTAQVEEGWRWRNNLVVKLVDTNIDLQAEHQRLADLIQQVHIRMRGEDWLKRNLLAFSFTLITQTAGGAIETRHITITHSKSMGAASRPILFQSGQDAFNPPDAFWAGIAPHWFFARKDVQGANWGEFRNHLYANFTNHASTIATPCHVHARCEEMAAAQPALPPAPLPVMAPEPWHRDYAHTELFLIKFLTDEKDAIAGQLLAPLAGLPEGTIIKALILNVHTRLDMCSRCAPSLYRAMVDTSPVNFSHYIKDQLQARNPDVGGVREMPILKIVVSSSMPLQNGMRRKDTGIDDHIADIIPLTPKRPLTQTPITLTPMRRPNVLTLPQSY